MTPAEAALALAVTSAAVGAIASAVRLGVTLGGRQHALTSQENTSKQLTSGHSDIVNRVTILETEMTHVKQRLEEVRK